MMFFSRERLRRLVGDPDLRQKAAGVKLRQHTSIDLIGFDLGVGNQADLFGVGDNHPTDVRSDHCGNRSRIAGGFDNDDVVVGQLLGKFLQLLATHDDATQPAELAVFPGHRLGKSAVNIQSNEPHNGNPPFLTVERELAGNTTPTDPRSQRIRASRKGRPCNELGLSAQGLSAACPHLCAPGAPCPRWAHHNLSSPRKRQTRGAPQLSCRIMESASASIALSWTSFTGSRSARRSITRSTSCRPISTPGWSNTTIVDRIRGVGALARPRCKPSLTQSHWRGRNSWPLDHDYRYTGSDGQPTVRSSLSKYT